MMQYILHPAEQRGAADHGRLQSRFSFSFANYYNPDMMGFGVLRVLNDDIVAGGNGFGSHPHQNMEIISIPTQGLLEHKDSTGTVGTIRPGEVQIMSAGSGIMHSEYNGSATDAVKFFQIWIQPKLYNTEPRYDQKFFDQSQRINKLQLLVSPDGRENSLIINQDAFLYRTDLHKDQKLTYIQDKPSNSRYIFVISGEVQVDEQYLQPRDGLAVIGEGPIMLYAHQNADILIFDIPNASSVPLLDQ